MRVLLVDVGAASEPWIEQVLAERGHHVLQAEGTADALARMAVDPPSIVLVACDATRPGWNSLLRELHTTRGDEQALILALCRGGDPETTMLAALDAGADDIAFLGEGAPLLRARIAAAERRVVERARHAERYARLSKVEIDLFLEERMASLSTLSARIAHEMNNPLAYVIANVDTIAEEFEVLGQTSSKEKLREIAEMIAEIRQGAERMRKIISVLGVFARADEDRREALDVRDALDIALGMAMEDLFRRASLVKEYEKTPTVLANEARLVQVFFSLLVNAVQSLPEGQADRNTIRVLTRTASSGRVIVEVHDTGEGIPAENLRKIFDPFFTTKPIGIGVGLGLSICHRIVASLGGEIRVESELGKGTSFFVDLPVAGPTALDEETGATTQHA